MAEIPKISPLEFQDARVAYLEREIDRLYAMSKHKLTLREQDYDERRRISALHDDIREILSLPATKEA